MSCWNELGVQMMCLCFCCNGLYKWLLKSSVSLSDSGSIQVGRGCFWGGFFGCFFFKLGNEGGKLVSFQFKWPQSHRH